MGECGRACECRGSLSSRRQNSHRTTERVSSGGPVGLAGSQRKRYPRNSSDWGVGHHPGAGAVELMEGPLHTPRELPGSAGGCRGLRAQSRAVRRARPGAGLGTRMDAPSPHPATRAPPPSSREPHLPTGPHPVWKGEPEAGVQ